MPKALSPRGGQQPRGSPSRQATLPRDLVDEVRRTTRPQDQEQVLSRLSRAIELLERGDSGAAASEAEKAKRRASRSSAVREVLGLAYYGQGRWQEAVTELKAYRRISGRPDQNHLIADSLRGMGKPQEVVPLAEEALRDRAVPADAKAEVVIVTASALADQGKIPEAIAFLRRASTKDDVSEPWALRLWYVRGDILEKAGRRDEAATEFRRIVRHDPSAFDAAERLAALD